METKSLQPWISKPSAACCLPSSRRTWQDDDQFLCFLVVELATDSTSVTKLDHFILLRIQNLNSKCFTKKKISFVCFTVYTVIYFNVLYIFKIGVVLLIVWTLCYHYANSGPLSWPGLPGERAFLSQRWLTWQNYGEIKMSSNVLWINSPSRILTKHYNDIN